MLRRFSGWTEVWSPVPDSVSGQMGKLRFIVSGETEQDGKRWVHLSIIKANAIPEWNELVRVRNAVLGEEALCLHIVSRRSQHVNIHPYCMHLWWCVDGDPVPDFTKGSGLL